MGRNKKYGNITFKPEDREKLLKLANSQTSEYRKVQREKILLLSADGMSNAEIASSIGAHRKTPLEVRQEALSSDMPSRISYS